MANEKVAGAFDFVQLGAHRLGPGAQMRGHQPRGQTHDRDGERVGRAVHAGLKREDDAAAAAIGLSRASCWPAAVRR